MSREEIKRRAVSYKVDQLIKASDSGQLAREALICMQKTGRF